MQAPGTDTLEPRVWMVVPGEPEMLSVLVTVTTANIPQVLPCAMSTFDVDINELI